MSNNPIDTNSFRHYLNFKSLGFTSLYEITEPVGFDVANFVVTQEDGRFGADIIYGNDKANEVYYNAWGFEKRNVVQTHNPQGESSNYLDMGFAWILETWQRFGAEGEIERILEKDGLTFTVGLFDMANNPDTDGFSYFGCNIIQNNKIANYKKQLTTSIDLLGTKNILNEPITPAPTLKVLRHSVPITKTSEWAKTVDRTFFNNFSTSCYFTFNNNAVTSGISYTNISTSEVIRFFFTLDPRGYTYAQQESGGSSYTPRGRGECMKLITALKKINKIKVRVKFKGSILKRTDDSRDVRFRYILSSNNGDLQGAIDGNNYQSVFDIPVLYNSWTNIDVDTIYDFTGVVEANQFLYGAFAAMIPGLPYVLSNCELNIEDSYVQVIASEVAIDTVINMVRYIDVLKQCSKFINDTPINAPSFDYGGEHYNNACYNRSLLSMQTNNSLILVSPDNPLGQEIGDVVNNTIDNGTMHIGLHFWNGTEWIPLNSTITKLSLISSSSPSGSVGDLIFNTNKLVSPVGLCFWNDSFWQSLELSRPFLTNFEDAFANSMAIESFADYEIQENSISLLEFKDYYKNIEIGSFPIIPSKNFKEYVNDKFKLNNISIAYETYDTNRQSENTSEDIHTSLEFSIPNIQSFDKFDKAIKYIRSGQTAQIMVDLEVSKPSTAYENDEKVFINSIVPLAAGNFNTIIDTLYMNIVSGQLKILNKKSDGSNDNVIINWISLGLSVGATFEILSGDNSGIYTVFSLTNSEIVLTPVGFTPTFNGDSTIEIKYYYADVFWQTETTERVTVISGLNNPDKQLNLYYTLKRTLLKWGSYFRTAALRHEDKILKELKFWNNPKLVSNYLGVDLTEIDDVNVSDLELPIITDTIYELEITVGFEEVLNLLNTLKTTRGFIRCLHIDGRIIKGYCRKSVDYTWKTGSLKLKIEEKFEPKTIDLIYSSGILTVNDVVYDLNGNINWWRINGDYFTCFDAKSMQICNIRHYSEVSLNGVIYTNIDDLVDALLSL